MRRRTARACAYSVCSLSDTHGHETANKRLCRPISQTRKPTFTDRDWRILEHIWEFDGVLADYQIKQLEFADNADLQQTKNRLSLLFHTGYVARLNRAGWTRYGCNVYWLTKRGREG